MQSDSNIGMVGPDSVRLNGRCIENLPIAESARAKDQIPSVYEADRQTKISTIKGKYPKGTVAYYESSIKEAKGNIGRIRDYGTGLRKQILEYTTQLSMCDHRDKMINQILEDDQERDQKIRDLRKQFPLYDVEAMKTQIGQFEEGIQRCEDVIVTENNSIAELHEAIGLAKQRDLELNDLGEA